MVDFISNIILGISLTLPLGPVVLEIFRRGIAVNFLESVKTAIGSFSAELTYFTLVYLGLSRFSESFIVKYILGFLGVGFLIYLGHGNIKEYYSTRSDTSKLLKKNGFISGYLITFLNPSNFFMWVGIIGASFASNTNFFVSSGILFGIFPSLFAYSLLSKFGKKFIKKKGMKYISLTAGLFLIFYGLKLFGELLFP